VKLKYIGANKSSELTFDVTKIEKRLRLTNVYVA